MKIIKIKDYYGKIQEVPVSDELYEEWLAMRRESERIRKREKYHRSELDPEYAYGLYHDREDPVMDHLLEEERTLRICEAISKLTPTQQRRVRMIMDGMNISEVATAEKIKYAPAYRTIHAAFLHLQKLLKE